MYEYYWLISFIAQFISFIENFICYSYIYSFKNSQITLNYGEYGLFYTLYIFICT